MLQFESINNKIIQNSSAEFKAQTQTVVAPIVNSNQNAKQDDKEKKKKISASSLMIGATALAGIIAGTIIIVRGRGSSPVKPANPSINSEDEIKLIELLKQNELLRFNGENKIRKNISNWFKKTIEGPLGTDDFNKITARIIKLTGCEEQNSFRFSNKIFSVEEAEAAASLQRHNKFNYMLRAGKKITDGENEFNILKKIIQDAKPLEEDTVVYRGIRIKKIWDDFSDLDFAKGLKEGAIFQDKGFAAVSRVYGNELAQVDPIWLEEPVNGYIMRIKLPKGTKGIDCRAYSGIDSSKGVNSVFYLPPDSKFHITKINNDDRIIDCEYLLP